MVTRTHTCSLATSVNDTGTFASAIDWVGAVSDVTVNGLSLDVDESGEGAFAPPDNAEMINTAPIKNNTTAPTSSSGVGMPLVKVEAERVVVGDNVGTRSLLVD